MHPSGRRRRDAIRRQHAGPVLRHERRFRSGQLDEGRHRPDSQPGADSAAQRAVGAAVRPAHPGLRGSAPLPQRHGHCVSGPDRAARRCRVVPSARIDMEHSKGRAELVAVARQFLHELGAVRRLSPLSVAAYRRDLQRLSELTEGRALPDLTAADVRRAAARLHAQGLAPASIARMLSAWRAFFRYLAAHGASSSNPALAVKGPRRPQRLPKALAPDQAVAFASQAGGEGVLALRDHAIVELLYSSGLRLSELVALDQQPYPNGPSQRASLGWIDLAEHELTVTGKGSKRRSVPIGRSAVEALRAWLAARPALAHGAERA